jgi:hypothetical protein
MAGTENVNVYASESDVVHWDVALCNVVGCISHFPLLDCIPEIACRFANVLHFYESALLQ